MWLDELGKHGYIQLWFLSRKVPTAPEGGAALTLALNERSSQAGGWDGCRAEYVSTSDITRAIKAWDEPTFRQRARRMLGIIQEAQPEAPPHILEPGDDEDNGQQGGVVADERDLELAQPDHLDEPDDDPGADDRELDMDWEPTARDNDNSPSSSEEDRPRRQVVGRRHQAQAPRVPPPLRHQGSRSPFEGPQAPRQLIQVVIPPREGVAPGEDVDNQLEQRIVQEQAAAIVGEQDYRLLLAMVPTMRQVLAAHVSPEHLETFLTDHMDQLNALIIQHPKDQL
jgi:hypothetical protein